MNQPVMTRTSRRVRGLLVWVAMACSALLVAGVVSAFPVAVSPATAATVDLSAFDPGMIITNEVFYDSATMSASSIQSFLQARDPSCVTHTTSGTTYTCLSDFKQTTTTRAADAYCAAYTGKSNESAAAIMANVSAACDINPQVLLVTLQKEQGFITGGARTSAIYRKAMGFACPDSGSCSSKYYGFFNQVYSAAHQFQIYRQHPTDFNFQAGKTNKIQFSPNASCGTESVLIRNQATAGLYDYTPYVPNSAAIKAGSGVGNSCSSYGNRNFFYYFLSFFGNPANVLKSAGFEFGDTHWVSGTTGSVAYSVVSSSSAQSGTHYLSIGGAAGGSIRQSVSVPVKNGGVYAAGAWLKSETAGTTFSGTLRAGATGSATTYIDEPFTVGDTWTWVSTRFEVDHSGLSTLRLSVILGSTSGKLDIDGTELDLDTVQSPVTAVSLSHPSFEGSHTGWVALGPSGITGVVKKSTSAESGSYYFAARSSQSGQAVRQRVAMSVPQGTSYVLGGWVKASPSSTKPYVGRIRLATVGGTQDASVTSFSVGKTWTYVTVTLDIANSGHIAISPEILLDTVGSYLELDNFSLTRSLITDGSLDGATTQISADSGSPTLTTVDGSALGITPIDGSGMLEAASTGGTSSAFSVDVTRELTSNESFTATAWVRSAVAGAPVTGSLTLIGVSGGGTESSTTTFTTTNAWQEVTVSHAMQGPGTALQLQFTIDDSGRAMLVDRMQLN